MTVLPEIRHLDSIHHEKNRQLSWAFAVLCMALGLSVHASAMDRMWMTWAHRQDWLPDQLWLFLTQWGDSAQALVLVLAVFMHLPKNLAIALKTWLMGVIAAPLLKMIANGARPLSVIDPLLLVVIGKPPSLGQAMPSGHAMAAGAVATLLLLSLDNHRVLSRLCIFLAFALVALSRVAVGAHWPSDVLVGAGLGCFLVLVAQEWEYRQPWSGLLGSKSVQFVLVVLMALLLWVLWQLPSEGWGMSMARAVVSAISTLCVVRVCFHSTPHFREKETQNA
jgi:membrane-associated phospholipid phosphatase